MESRTSSGKRGQKLLSTVDENSQNHDLDRTQPLLPMRPGQPQRQAHDYVRCGTTSLSAALNVATREFIGECHRRHRSIEFEKFMNTVDEQVLEDLDVHLVMDDYAMDKTPAIQKWLAQHPPFYVHFTPTGASWTNMVERWFATSTAKQLRRRTHRSTRQLEAAITDYTVVANGGPKPFV